MPDRPPSLGIAERLEQVWARIHAAQAAAGRAPDSVRLLAVSKTQPAAAVREAAAAGQRAFGENYLQEARAKQAALADLNLEWHFIGRIQGNKTAAIATAFHWVHGLCEARHAHRLNAQRPGEMGPLQVCIQVNLSGEASKAGVAPEALGGLIEEIQGLSRLRLRGLMTLPAPAAGLAAQRLPFRRLRELRDLHRTPERPLDTLSMGMSGDLEAAILEGATLVRIGTSIFGPRDYG